MLPTSRELTSCAQWISRYTMRPRTVCTNGSDDIHTVFPSQPQLYIISDISISKPCATLKDAIELLYAQCSRILFAEPSWPLEYNACVLLSVQIHDSLTNNNHTGLPSQPWDPKRLIQMALMISTQVFLHSIVYAWYLISQYESLVLYWKKPVVLFMCSVQEHCSLNLVDVSACNRNWTQQSSNLLKCTVIKWGGALSW